MSDDAFRVTVARSGKTAVVRLDGELDCASAPELETVLGELLRTGAAPRRVLFDADRLSFVDVAGLRPLVRLAERLPGAVSLCNTSSTVRRVVELLQYDQVLGVDG